MDNAISNMEISELIITRISHDVIGNIGAVSNAVELLEEGDMDFIDDITSILKNSSSVLSARMKFFRMAFGLDNANLENIELVDKTLNEYIASLGNANNKINIELSLKNGMFARISLLAAMITADTFVRGGIVSIKQSGAKLIVKSDNNSLVKDKVFIIKEVIRGNINDKLAQYAPILYLKQILKEKNLNVLIEDNDKFDFIIE